MKAHIETIDGKVTLKVFYDPALFNWDEAIAAGLASFGLKQGQAAVLALPFPAPGGIGCAKSRPPCFLQAKNRRIKSAPKKGRDLTKHNICTAEFLEHLQRKNLKKPYFL